MAITLAGLAGSLFDSLLGATVQAMYLHPESGELTEKHLPGAEVARGWPLLSNDRVNLLASLFWGWRGRVTVYSIDIDFFTKIIKSVF